MSAFTGPLAQAREALVRLIAFEESHTGERSPDNDLLPALAQVERRATDMETALQEAADQFSVIRQTTVHSRVAPNVFDSIHDFAKWGEEDINAVLSAREEGADTR